jgi:CHAD domain-containing protein
MYRAPTLFAGLRQELMDSIAAARDSASPDNVHKLRKLLRRMEALLHKLQQDHRGAQELQQSCRKSLDRLKRLRRLAGEVRDRDVQRDFAESLLRGLPPDSHLRPAVIDEWQRLAAALDRSRGEAVARLTSRLATDHIKLEHNLLKVASALKDTKGHDPAPAATARDWVSRSEGMLAAATPKTLHDLRKRTKEARYVAELAACSASTREMVRRLHRLQDAIGKWHDLDLLRQQCKRTLGRKAGLTNLCRENAEAALGKALRVTSRLHGDLHGARAA